MIIEHGDDAVTSLELKGTYGVSGRREELEWKPLVMIMLIQYQITVRFKANAIIMADAFRETLRKPKLADQGGCRP